MNITWERQRSFNAEDGAFKVQINFFGELGTCYPNNGKKFSGFPDCLVFLKVLLSILTKLFRRIFSLEKYESIAVNFWQNSCWCCMFWLNKGFITSCWSIKKHCHSVRGDALKIQYVIACQNSVCIWFLELIYFCF